MANTASRPSYLSKAASYEAEGDLRMALFFLTIAANISPEDGQISERLTELKKRIDQKASFHFKQGVDFYRRSDMEKARQAFLSTLRYNPEHIEALNYLKSQISPFKSLSYRAKKGESKKAIAEKAFHDPAKAFIISYFYEKTRDQEVLSEEMALALPYLESIPLKQADKSLQPSDTPSTSRLEEAPRPVFNIARELSKAEELMKGKRYDDVLKVADKILDHDYLNMEAEGLISKVFYQKGCDLFEQKRYLEAQTSFGYVDPKFINTGKILVEIKTILQKQAETHYLKGVKLFINEELENAISEWETVLTLDPEHEKAQNDIRKAKQLLKKLRDIE